MSHSSNLPEGFIYPDIMESCTDRPGLIEKLLLRAKEYLEDQDDQILHELASGEGAFDFLDYLEIQPEEMEQYFSYVK